MVQMVRVLEVGQPSAGYMAEVPGVPGRFILAEDIPQLQSRLRQAVADPSFARMASFAVSTTPRTASSTDLYLQV